LGGGMANTFLKANGVDVRMSIVEDELLVTARRIIIEAKSHGVELHLPKDVVAAERFAADAGTQTAAVSAIPRGYMVLDIGPETVREYARALQRAKAVV